MQNEQATITLPPSLYNQFNRLKAQGSFPTDQALMQAAFEALDREARYGREAGIPSSDRYMSHPGLSLDDYDT